MKDCSLKLCRAAISLKLTQVDEWSNSVCGSFICHTTHMIFEIPQYPITFGLVLSIMLLYMSLYNEATHLGYAPNCTFSKKLQPISR